MCLNVGGFPEANIHTKRTSGHGSCFRRAVTTCTANCCRAGFRNAKHTARLQAARKIPARDVWLRGPKSPRTQPYVYTHKVQLEHRPPPPKTPSIGNTVEQCLREVVFHTGFQYRHAPDAHASLPDTVAKGVCYSESLPKVVSQPSFIVRTNDQIPNSVVDSEQKMEG